VHLGVSLERRHRDRRRGAAADQDHPGALRRLEAALAEAHPYELPEIIAVPLEAGLPAYLAWVAPKPPAASLIADS
jgi:hypothetical protein